MLKFAQILLILLLLSPSLASAEAAKWQTEKSTHFIIYYKNAEPRFIEQLVEKSEEYYNKIADGLGFTRYNFWLWDNRAKVYIYDNVQDYQAATGQPVWSGGCAIAKAKTIYTFPYARGFFETTLPHELGHIIFREFVGFDNPAVPIWLDEGVASFQEQYRLAESNSMVGEAVRQGSLIGLDRLSQMNPQMMLDAVAVRLYYAESLSVVNYLVKEFGSDNFARLCEGLRDKRSLIKAIDYAYPFRDLKELDKAWQEYLSRQ